MPKEKQKEKQENDKFGQFMEDFGLEAFLPFIKFKNFGDYIIATWIKNELEEIKGFSKPTLQMYVVVHESNINVINENTDAEEIVESLENMKVKFAIPSNVMQKIKQIDLVPNQTIIGIKKSHLSDYKKAGNHLIIFDVFTKESL